MWDRWLKSCRKLRPNITHVKALLLGIANAETQVDTEKAEAKMKDKSYWKSSKDFRHYYETYWEECKPMWVFCYRKGRGFYIRTNNGLERMNRTFKYDFLGKQRNHSFSTMLGILIEIFVPTLIKEYAKNNKKMNKCVAKSYKDGTPEYLKYRPPWFVRHCLKKSNAAKKNFTSRHVLEECEVGVFKVRLCEHIVIGFLI